MKQSVFGQWVVDLDVSFKKCFLADMQYSKLKKFLKEGSDSYNQVCDYLLKNYGKIFEVFLNASGRSHYPSIQWMDFTDMCTATVSGIFS